MQGVPFIAVQRSDKVRDLCSDIALAVPGVTLDKVDVAVLLDQAAEIEQRRVMLTDQLGQRPRIRLGHSLRNNVAMDALSAVEPHGAGLPAL